MKIFNKKHAKFINDLKKLKSSTHVERFSLCKDDFMPFLNEATESTSFDRHYVFHTAWAVRKLKQIAPKHHTDISSSVYFSALGSAICPITFYDYRPAHLDLSDLTSKHGDLLNLSISDSSVDSLSCMHVVEHVGLGRYGDPIDYDGDLKAVNELKRILSPGGNLLFVVPIGSQAKIQFNAHRIYTFSQIMDYFSDLKLNEFSFIENEGENSILEHFDPKLINEEYGCGCFWFTK